MVKIYISGKITGLDKEFVRRKFGKTEEWLKSLGYETINPETLVPADIGSWEAAMRICVKSLADCDIVLAQPDVYQSEGARTEIALAVALNIPVVHELYGHPTDELAEIAERLS